MMLAGIGENGFRFYLVESFRCFVAKVKKNVPVAVVRLWRRVDCEVGDDVDMRIYMEVWDCLTQRGLPK